MYVCVYVCVHIQFSSFRLVIRGSESIQVDTRSYLQARFTAGQHKRSGKGGLVLQGHRADAGTDVARMPVEASI